MSLNQGGIRVFVKNHERRFDNYMITLLKGAELKQQFDEYVTRQVRAMSQQVNLHIIQIGDDFASTKYIEIKQKMAGNHGIKVQTHRFTEDVNAEEVQRVVDSIHGVQEGLIFQLPVPDRFRQLVSKVFWQSDVDLLGVQSQQLWTQGILPPTVGAIHLILQEYFSGKKSLEKKLIFPQVDFLEGKTVVVLGQGKLVGAPLLQYLQLSGATIISLNKDSQDVMEYTQCADVLISATGQAGLITPAYVSDSTLIIDAGTSESNGALVGDVDTESFSDVDLQNVTLVPSPGGIGRLTVLSLFWNVVQLARLR
jgi:methylenetetrahydrofolate dehydrogenase (NADP+)/methenyltetrahydrofolate cyclohydrolase